MPLPFKNDDKYYPWSEYWIYVIDLKDKKLKKEERVEGYERDKMIEASKNSTSDRVEVPNYLIPEVVFDAG